MNLRKGLGLLGMAGLGAGIMYLSDPVSGKRRLSLIRDQVIHVRHRVLRTVTGRAEDVKNRLYGLYCEAKSRMGSHCEPTSPGRIRRAG
jgi:hypothetical protein